MNIESNHPLAQILPGTWDSAIMTLAFDPLDTESVPTGKVISLANGKTIDFAYQLTEEQGLPVLLLRTAVMGELSYQIKEWDDHALTLVKKGYETVTAFVKRRRA